MMCQICVRLYSVRFGSFVSSSMIIFFFNAPTSTEIYTLSLHDALPTFQLAHENDMVIGNRPSLSARHRSEVRRHERSEEHTSELQSHSDLVCRLLLEKKKIFQICVRPWSGRFGSFASSSMIMMTDCTRQ